MYRSVGWESPCIEQIETALNNSYAKFVAYDGDKPVGMVRIIGDGGMSFYIKDYAVIPEYQSKGLGKALMQFLEDYIHNSMPLCNAVMIIVSKYWFVNITRLKNKSTAEKIYGAI